MPLSSQWTLSQLRTAVREEVLDPLGTKPWSWTDSELNTYINWWQEELQKEREFVFGTATATVSASTGTLTFTSFATDILRLDGIWGYFPTLSTNTVRLTPQTVYELNRLKREWRSATVNFPIVAYQEDYNTVSFFPAPSVAGTFTFEYPMAMTTMTADGQFMQQPAFTKYSVINFVAKRCYRRHGPNQDIQKAAKYENLWKQDLNQFRLIRDAYQPEKFLSLRPGGVYERQILQPDFNIANIGGATIVPAAGTAAEYNEAPSGTIDGVNLAFTLTNTPNPTNSLLLFLSGILLIQGLHYTLSTKTITFVSGYQPVSGQTLWANYQYLA